MIVIMCQSTLRDLFNGGRRVDHSAGATIFRENDAVRSALWLEAGRAELTRVSAEGRRIVLHASTGPCWFAEASVFAARYHCDARAATDVTLIATPKVGFVAALTQNAATAEAAMAVLARDLRAARARSELLALPRVADRLDAWLAVDGAKPDTVTWATVAAEIGVSPEALYRELATRRRRAAAVPPRDGAPDVR